MSNKDEMTFQQLHEACANSLSHADKRIEMLSSIQDQVPRDALPDEVYNTLRQEAVLLVAFTHLVMGAIETGLLSREAMLEYVSRERGMQGARRLERIFQDHVSCWEKIKSSKPEVSAWQPPLKGE